MSSNKYTLLVPAVVGLLAAIGMAVWAFKTESETDDLVAVAAVLDQSAKTADAAAEVATADGNRPACIAAKATAALAASAAGTVASAAAGKPVCSISALEFDASVCPAPAPAPEQPAEAATPVEAAPADPAEPAPAPELAKPSVDVPAVVEASIGPVLSALSGLAKQHDGKAAGNWVAAALDFANGGRESIIGLIEDPSAAKLTIPEVKVQGCHNE